MDAGPFMGFADMKNICKKYQTYPLAMLNKCSRQITCKPCLQLFTLVGNNVVIGWYERAARAVQAELESTVSVCGVTKITIR